MTAANLLLLGANKVWFEMRFDHECQLSDRLSETKQTFSINSDLFENANNFGRNFFFRWADEKI